jgi:hypothetical protein
VGYHLPGCDMAVGDAPVNRLYLQLFSLGYDNGVKHLTP